MYTWEERFDIMQLFQTFSNISLKEVRLIADLSYFKACVFPTIHHFTLWTWKLLTFLRYIKHLNFTFKERTF